MFSAMMCSFSVFYTDWARVLTTFSDTLAGSLARMCNDDVALRLQRSDSKHSCFPVTKLKCHSVKLWERCGGVQRTKLHLPVKFKIWFTLHFKASLCLSLTFPAFAFVQLSELILYKGLAAGGLHSVASIGGNGRGNTFTDAIVTLL